MKQLKFHITNKEDFITKLNEWVNTSISIRDFRANPFQKSDYFGEIKFGNFVIYSTRKSIIGRRVILKITGTLNNDDQLVIKVKRFALWMPLVNNLILVGIGSVLVAGAYYPGIVFIIMAILQLSWTFYIAHKERLKFITRIQKMIEK
ncbi:hypothetical protein [Prolixibacter denitrificans]|uniref:Uncharacterized protein n=1 Tax=Prolixibacter denitrificans TaxID=1541063 RepID=A0A2P8C5S8_9BACT|nr:hypothetical protein [Prolixibacter denitrificans]PSK80319.1 hypothetical protein CLV93_11822 [Prolixibacter denitrificans]GET23129.1 hypothetical protein JCM18694_33750 [Prolixibacter denitrificans]